MFLKKQPLKKEERKKQLILIQILLKRKRKVGKKRKITNSRIYWKTLNQPLE
jgi:hypothetical protein